VSGSHRGRPSSDAPAARAAAFALTTGSDQQPSDCTSALQAAANGGGWCPAGAPNAT